MASKENSRKKPVKKEHQVVTRRIKDSTVQIDSKIPAPIKFTTIDNLEVKNQTAYEEFMTLSESPWISERRYYRSQHDKLLTIDLLLRKREFDKAIVHLPAQEKLYISGIRFIVEKAYLAITKAKNAAIGQEAWTTSFQRSNIDDMIIIENRKADIMALFGRMYSAEEVHKIVTHDWKVDVTIHAIENYRTRNLDKIVELQKDYSNNYTDVRLGYKKSRLEEYMWLYGETKQQYENTNSKEDRKFLKELLESIKREVEGDVIRIEGDLQVNIEHTLNVHIQQEIYKKLPINEIIMTRVALRTGVNPLLLLYRLQSSYYAKYTGFSPQKAVSAEASLPDYPSAHVYDLDKLQALHHSVTINEGSKLEKFDKFMEVSTTKTAAATSLKAIIAEKLKQRQIDLEKGISNVNNSKHD